MAKYKRKISGSGHVKNKKKTVKSVTIVFVVVLLSVTFLTTVSLLFKTATSEAYWYSLFQSLLGI